MAPRNIYYMNILLFLADPNLPVNVLSGLRRFRHAGGRDGHEARPALLSLHRRPYLRSRQLLTQLLQKRQRNGYLYFLAIFF